MNRSAQRFQQASELRIIADQGLSAHIGPEAFLALELGASRTAKPKPGLRLRRFSWEQSSTLPTEQ